MNEALDQRLLNSWVSSHQYLHISMPCPVSHFKCISSRWKVTTLFMRTLWHHCMKWVLVLMVQSQETALLSEYVVLILKWFPNLVKAKLQMVALLSD